MLENKDYNMHPVYLDDYAVYTPSIDRFFNQITVWVDNMVPGAYIYGRPRLGKSRSIRYWLNDLLDEYYCGHTTLYRMQYKLFQNSTENNFLEELVSAVKGPNTSIGRARSKTLKYDAIADHIITEAKEKKSNKVIFVIDEAQNIPEIGYRWLCNFQNQLDEFGIRITFLLVGSNELSHQSTAFRKTGNAQIIGRFMLHSSKFHGVLSLEELRYVLDGYDTDSEWPKGSKTSFTAFFFTNAYQNGFRMSSYADVFWNIYTEQFPGKLGDLEVPMEHIGKAINFIFRRYGNDIESDIQLSENNIKEAINHTQYSEYMATVW